MLPVYPRIAPILPHATMSGPGVGSSPNWAFAALSARWRSAGGSKEASELNEIEQFIADGDDENLTAALDRRCRALEGMGLVKVDKVSLDSVTEYKVGDAGCAITHAPPLCFLSRRLIWV